MTTRINHVEGDDTSAFLAELPNGETFAAIANWNDLSLDLNITTQIRRFGDNADAMTIDRGHLLYTAALGATWDDCPVDVRHDAMRWADITLANWRAEQLAPA